jgi:hypothetical protein
VLVLASEMAGPCTLDSVRLLCGSDVYNHGIFLNGGVYACHTTVTELDSAYEANYAGNTPEAAMTRDTLALRWKNGDWQGFGFDHQFDYNGVDNLILEFRWQGDNDSSVYDLGWYTPGNRALDVKSSTGERGTPRNYMPRFRIFYSTTGITEARAGLPANGLPIMATPNPFRARTAIRLRLAADSPAALAVFDAAGRRVRTLSVNRAKPVVWDGTDDVGHALPAGAYFAVLDAGAHHASSRLVLQR